MNCVNFSSFPPFTIGSGRAGTARTTQRNACEVQWQIARLKELATAVTIRQGGRVEIPTESWVDEAESHHTARALK